MGERPWCVYIHTSPSNKVYIGITSQEPQRRWGNGRNYRDQGYFYAAIKKYGWNNFDHKILFKGLDEFEAKQKEVELIALYKSNNKALGYNLTKGGDGISGYSHTEETRKKIGDNTRQMFEKPGVREKFRLRFSGANNPFYGKNFTKEHKAKLREAHLGKKRAPHTPATKLKIAVANTGKKKPHAGVPRSKECREKMSASISKAVLQFTRSGMFIQEYPSGKKASLETGTAAGGISACCRGERKTANGFIWKFKNN